MHPGRARPSKFIVHAAHGGQRLENAVDIVVRGIDGVPIAYRLLKHAHAFSLIKRWPQAKSKTRIQKVSPNKKRSPEGLRFSQYDPGLGGRFLPMIRLG